MASGVKVNAQCGQEFEKMKMSKEYRYVIFKLNDKLTEIVVDECGPRDATYDDMKAKLLEHAANKECRYACFDLEFKTPLEGNPANKIVFVAWNPENSTLKPRMVYTSSKDYLKKALQVVPELQATDADELSIENAIEKASKGMRN